MSLTKIRTKVKASYYSDLKILEKDLNVVFNNAMEYYPPGSLHYNNASYLQQFMSEKKNQLEKTEEYLAMREYLPERRSKRQKEKAVLCILDESCRSLVNELKTQSYNQKRGRPKNVKQEIGDSPRTPLGKRNKMQDEMLDPNDPKSLKKRLTPLFSCVNDYKDSEGRNLSAMFQQLPDKKEYPDYYKIITNPIDMKTIQQKLASDEYESEEEFIHDFEVLFQNARHYNEEGSEIYEDSVSLEKTLKKKRRWLSHIVTDTKSPMKQNRQCNSPSITFRRTNNGSASAKCQELLYYICNFMDESGRNLAEPFQRLPSRMEYPDYYQLIKRPIDLNYITSRVNKYGTIDDLEQDLLLLFDNACHFNEPDSQIYKDALTLLRGMFKKKSEISPDVENIIPDVQMLVQKLLKTLYQNIMNYKDEEGRLYSDSLLELMATLKDNDEVSPVQHTVRKPISLPIVGQLIDLGLYKRLDHFQDDLFAIFKKARREATTDSEMYEDACELEMYFIIERDRLCKDGLRLTSRALNTTLKFVQNEIDAQRKDKQKMESQEDEDEDDENKKMKLRLQDTLAIEVQPEEEDLTYLKTFTLNNITYRAGDYVYVKPEEANVTTRVFSVDKIWQQKDGLQGIYGCWYYRPESTFHLASRKFLDKELFRCYRSNHILTDGIVGKCFVMHVKEYSKQMPEGFDAKDVYVCESRYNVKGRSFTKIKSLGIQASHIIMLNRNEPLQLKRVSSAIVGTSSQPDKRDKEEKLEQVELESIEGYEFDKEKNFEVDAANGQSDCKNFDRYATDKYTLKIGDGVYIESDEGYPLLLKINKIVSSNNKLSVQGNSFLLPEDTKHAPTQLFNEKECFESNIEETVSVEKIIGKFAVLNLRDYQACRPTEILEDHIYLCMAHYNEDEHKTRKSVKGFKVKVVPSPASYRKNKKQKKRTGSASNMRDDEYWYFDQPINTRKRPSKWLLYSNEEQEKEMLKEKEETEGIKDRNEEDDGDKQEDEMDNEKEREKLAFEIMKKEFIIIHTKDHPDDTEDDIEKKVKEKWESLTTDEKEELIKRVESEEKLYIYECAWSNCQYQFEDLQDLMVHVMEGSHVVKSSTSGRYPCLWRGCLRNDDESKSFPTHSRVVRHIREIHFKEGRKQITNADKTKFYFPRYQACDDGFKMLSEGGSDRSSSHGSSIHSLSPSHQQKNAPMPRPQFPPNIMPNNPGFQNISNSPMPAMQAGFFPPYRMGGAQVNPQQQALIQQQMLQQQLILQARGQMLRHTQPPPPNGVPPPQANLMNQPGGRNGAMEQPKTNKVLHPNQNDTVNASLGGLSHDQQQVLIAQVQRQQQQIQQLQQQVHQLHQQKQQAEDKPPVFITPPTSTQKLRHSEAYLRYIEGLRDNQRFLSNWSEQGDEHPPTPAAQLPVHWLPDNQGYDSVTDALWALRDHMLRDAVTLSKLV